MNYAYFDIWPSLLIYETPSNIETNKVPSTLILLETFGKLDIFNKMWFQEVHVMKKKISNFLKTPVFSITLTFINDYVLNVDDIKEFWSFGLCWSLLAFIAFLDFATLDESFKQKVAFLAKIKHNWPVCINQMLKPISRWHQAF